MRVLIVNVFGSSNRGDAALVEQCIREISEAYPDAEISGLALNVNLERTHIPNVQWFWRIGSSGLKNNTTRQLFNLATNAIAVCSAYFGLDYLHKHAKLRFLESISAIRRADLVVSCPGGYFEDSNFSYLVNLTPILISAIMKKRVIMAPQSIGPVRSVLGKLAMAYVLSKTHAICVREDLSRNFVINELGIAREKVVRCGDMAFHLPIPDMLPLHTGPSALDLPTEYFAMTAVDWNFPGHRRVNDRREAYINAMAEAASTIYAKTGLSGILLNQVSSDLEIAREIAQRSRGALTVDDREISLAELLFALRKAKFLIGTRFHSCVFSIISSTPIIPISYLPKTNGILGDLRFEEPVHDIATVSADSLVSAAEKILTNIDLAKKKTRIAAEQYRRNRSSLKSVLLEA